MFEIITIVLLVIFLFYREYQHDRQISDLTTKIKAKTIEEYLIAKNSGKETKEVIDLLERAVNLEIEDADPEKVLSALKREQEIEKEEKELKE